MANVSRKTTADNGLGWMCQTICFQSIIFDSVKYRLSLFFCVLSLILIAVWQQVFHLTIVLVPLHILVAIAVHGVVLTCIAGVGRFVRLRFLSAVLVGVYAFFVCFFYLLIFGSVHYWGDIVTVKIIGTYFKDLVGFLHSLPFSFREVVIVAIVFVSLPVIVALLLSKRIEASLADLWSAVSGHRKVAVIVLVILILFSPFLLKGKRFVHQKGEPLMVMLFDHMWGIRDNPLFSQRRVNVGFRDQQIRKEYAQASHPTGKKNVILIIVDALRADHLSAYGYERNTSPYLKQLIADHKAVKVDKCYSTCASTLCGVTSILLSRTWEDCAVNGFNVIGLLHDNGYHTYTLISGAHKEWYNMAKFYSDDCTMYYDGKESKKYYFKDDRVLLEGLEKVPAYNDKPTFFYLHLQSTHETGMLQDKYAVYKPFKKSITTQSMNGEAAVNEYDNKVLQADDMIRQLMESLERKGYLKNSIVVITADHGQGLGEHGIYGHVDWLYDPQTSVPLIIYDDSLSVYKNLKLANHVDIAPTIVERIGLPRPKDWMGTSLMSAEIAPYSYHETGKDQLETGEAKYMIVSYGDSEVYKYIYTEGFKKEELYNMTKDPGEKNNLADTTGAFMDGLRSVAGNYIGKR
jgi:glucan phosphoethanolaminetransferase (alkaline phosphatase superfamily)